MKTLKTQELSNISASINILRLSSLDADSFMKMLDTKSEINKLIEAYKEDCQSLLKAYGVQSARMINGVLLTEPKLEADKQKTFAEKFDAINNKEVKLKTTNFLSKEKFFELVKLPEKLKVNVGDKIEEVDNDIITADGLIALRDLLKMNP